MGWSVHHKSFCLIRALLEQTHRKQVSMSFSRTLARATCLLVRTHVWWFEYRTMCPLTTLIHFIFEWEPSMVFARLACMDIHTFALVSLTALQVAFSLCSMHCAGLTCKVCVRVGNRSKQYQHRACYLCSTDVQQSRTVAPFPLHFFWSSSTHSCVQAPTQQNSHSYGSQKDPTNNWKRFVRFLSLFCTFVFSYLPGLYGILTSTVTLNRAIQVAG